ncbi:MAG: EI24 domain-containing protein [Novosphingobium sp.]
MLTALILSLRQLLDPAVLRVLLKSMAITLLLFVGLGGLAWWAGGWVLAAWGLSEELGSLVALLAIVLGAWLLWRIVALAVLQFFAVEVVKAVEARHYPRALATARDPDWREELKGSLAGAVRTVLFNLLALPLALLLLITGIGPALVFWLVNAVLLGRELTDMVWARHRHARGALAPVSRFERIVLGGVSTAMLSLPVANLLAPIVGAAMATHLIHRKDAPPDAA